MTLRQKYIKMRNSKGLDASFLFEYYKDKGGTIDMSTFMQAINMYSFTEIYEILDSEYNVTSLFSKEGVFIKAY